MQTRHRIECDPSADQRRQQNDKGLGPCRTLERGVLGADPPRTRDTALGPFAFPGRGTTHPGRRKHKATHRAHVRVGATVTPEAPRVARGSIRALGERERRRPPCNPGKSHAVARPRAPTFAYCGVGGSVAQEAKPTSSTAKDRACPRVGGWLAPPAKARRRPVGKQHGPHSDATGDRSARKGVIHKGPP